MTAAGASGLRNDAEALLGSELKDERRDADILSGRVRMRR